MQVSARVTVTPSNLELCRALDQFIDAGFHSVGFSPMLSAPHGYGEMQASDLKVMLCEMIDCGREFERRALAGERYPFANMVNAMREIGGGTLGRWLVDKQAWYCQSYATRSEPISLLLRVDSVSCRLV